ncbi:MAG: hypothetical protein ACXADH_05290 [Candidatus Kariarchaeaceae archaeon]|jgi:hypothetical protein
MPLGRPVTLTSNVASKNISIAATEGQTLFTVAGGYRINQLAVYRNGVRLVDASDYTARDGASVTLLSGATLDDTIEFQIFDDFRVADALTSDGGTVNGNILLGTGTTLSSGGVHVTGVITATSFVGNGSGLTGVANTDFIVGTAITMGTANFTGNVTIGGTLTYEDVTNVDSVGMVTARKGIQVLADGINITGITTVGTALSLADDVRARFGTSADLQIYHSSADGHSRIVESGPGRLYLNASQINLQNADESENMVRAVSDGAVTLYYNSSAKFDTDNHGAIVTGILTATSYRGDGSQLTGIEVGITTHAAVVSGIVTTLQLSDAQDHKLTVTGITTVDANGGTEGDSHTVRIINSGIATVGFSTYFLFPSGAAPDLPTADGAISLISFTVNRVGAGGTQLLAGASLNYS